jgi:hypothetical protein
MQAASNLWGYSRQSSGTAGKNGGPNMGIRGDRSNATGSAGDHYVRRRKFHVK